MPEFISPYSTDYNAKTGLWRKLLLEIDGISDTFWQRVEHPSVPASADGYDCLQPPREFSAGINLKEMQSDLSAMTFDLDDVKRADGLSFFGQLFATARWDSSEATHWRVAAEPTTRGQLDANAIDIPLDYAEPVAHGNHIAYLCGEKLTYHNIDTDAGGNYRMYGVNKGIDAVGGLGRTKFGRSYDRPPSTKPGLMPSVCTVPMTMIGRRVMLRMSIYDRSTAAWSSPANSLILWIGRISDRIIYDQRKRTWRISCVSILDDLDATIMANTPESTLDRINLNCSLAYRQITVKFANDSTSYSLDVPSGYYTIDTLVEALNASKKAKSYTLKFEIRRPGSTANVGIYHPSGSACTVTSYRYSHLSRVLGFDPEQTFESPEMSTAGTHYAPSTYFKTYMALNYLNNGGDIRVAYANQFWIDQGDEAAAYVELSRAKPFAHLDPAPYVIKITGRNGTALLAVSATQNGYTTKVTSHGWAGQRADEDPVVVKNVLVPLAEETTGVRRGPFRMLLNMLVSTGVKSFNGTFDVLPRECGVAFQSTLIDQRSFYSADSEIGENALSDRRGYIINKAVSFRELLQREAKLFGRAVCLNAGLLTLKNIVNPAVDTWVTAIDGSSYATRSEIHDLDISGSSVINEYEIKLDYDYSTEEYTKTIVVRDADSIGWTGHAVRVQIEHPGLRHISGSGSAAELLDDLVLKRSLRFPTATVEVSLAPYYIRKLDVGDVVLFSDSRLPDMFDAGGYGLHCYAVVHKIQWDYGKMVGKALLHLLANRQVFYAPLAPAAMINVTVASTGLNAATGAMALQDRWFETQDEFPKDGAAFKAGYWIDISETAPLNVLEPEKYTVQVMHDFEIGGNGILNISNAGLPLNAAKEYVVTYAEFSTAPTNQRSDGIWIANAQTKLVMMDRSWSYG